MVVDAEPTDRKRLWRSSSTQCDNPKVFQIGSLGWKVGREVFLLALVYLLKVVLDNILIT